MTYADDRRIIDVDSHLFELDDFLHAVATPEEAAYLIPMDAQTELPVSLEAMEKGREYLDRRNADPETMAKFEASMFDISRGPWSRLGAFDPADRSHALDVLGFERQIVLGTFSFHQVAHLDDAKPSRSAPGCITVPWARSVRTTTGCSPVVTCRWRSAPTSPAR